MKSITPADAVVVLNRALLEDAQAVRRLFEHRVECNEALSDDPTIQVRGYPTKTAPTIGVLGLINGLFGISENGYGFIEAVINEGLIVEFHCAQVRE